MVGDNTKFNNMRLKEIEELKKYCENNPEFEHTQLHIISGKLLEAIELLQYFTNKVEEGNIRSKKTYNKYKEFLKEFED